MLNKYDFTYNPNNSLVHNMNPIVKIGGLIIYIIICLLNGDNILNILNFTLVFGLLLFSNISIRRYLEKIWFLKYLLILFYVLMLNFLSYSSVNMLFIKIFFLIMYVLIILFTTCKEEFGYGTGFFINIFNVLGIWSNGVVNFMTNIDCFLENVVNNYNQLVLCNEIRGEDITYSGFTGKLSFVRKNVLNIIKNSFNDIKDSQSGMKYKLYDNKSKTKKKCKLNYFDIGFMVYYVLLIVYYILKVR